MFFRESNHDQDRHLSNLSLLFYGEYYKMMISFGLLCASIQIDCILTQTNKEKT